MTFTPDWGDAFWSKVHPEALSGCWLWHGTHNTNGYGRCRVNGRVFYAHRHAASLVHGEIPRGMDVCHSRDVRACVNPAHLFIGTRATNLADMVAKGRSARGERSGRRKLGEAEVAIVRERLRAGEMQKTIAADLGISQSAVSHINTGETWSDAPGQRHKAWRVARASRAA